MDDFDRLQARIKTASLEESRALNEMLLDALEQDRRDRQKTRRVSVVCATICLVAMLLFAAVLGIVASGVEITTTTETITQDTGEGYGDKDIMRRHYIQRQDFRLIGDTLGYSERTIKDRHKKILQKLYNAL